MWKKSASVTGLATYSASQNKVHLAIEPLVTCRLCLEECLVRDMYQLWDCKCFYCLMCVKQYVTVMIGEGNVLAITCPDSACVKQGMIGTQEIQNLVDSVTYEKYTRFRFLREVESDPTRTFCPKVGCETVCHVCLANPQAAAAAKSVKCPTCEMTFCSICKANWHDNITCDDVMRSGKKEEEGIPFSASEDAQIKRCPICHVPIERNDGCAQMMCKRCKHVFCWYCLASLDDDFLLRHYDKGPCKNRLGHSRASIVWHRTQVVGILAGFGVLLLVASPFLLLAAPCILCCKCKACKCCDEEDSGLDTLPSTT